VKHEVTIREHARLTTQALAVETLDRARISNSAFEWLCALNATYGEGGASLLQLEDRVWLRLDGYVGVIETPCGTRIEILPKHLDHADDVDASRRLLRRMIAAAIDLPIRVTDEASLQLFDAPLSEWVISRFLSSLKNLVKQGIRSDYSRVEAGERFLRGQLDMARQMRQGPERQHIFQINHDVFLPDRPENRLLRKALEFVCKNTRSPESWRLGHELRTLFHEVPSSMDIEADFRSWSSDRLMAHYEIIRPWCELVLRHQTPYTLAGGWQGISMLFPMARLFERYVALALARVLNADAKLVTQAAGQSLCRHLDSQMFRLRPDFLIEHDSRTWILDAKWKRIDQNARDTNYGISQADFYQLFAYGQKYLGGCGEMALIYPASATFQQTLQPFHFSPELRLWVIPIDLERMDLPLAGLGTFPAPCRDRVPDKLSGSSVAICTEIGG
jgi:5-methylcytosine-specific restriction enzyme subunit McrC